MLTSSNQVDQVSIMIVKDGVAITLGRNGTTADITVCMAN